MIIPPIRRVDEWGSGVYGAPRGHRKHKGIDYAAWPGSVLCSDVTGVVTKKGYVYSDDLSFEIVNIHVDENTRARYFYVDSCVFEGDEVTTGSRLGVIQDIGKRYPNITPHYHLQIEVDGKPVNPQKWLQKYDSRTSCIS